MMRSRRSKIGITVSITEITKLSQKNKPLTAVTLKNLQTPSSKQFIPHSKDHFQWVPQDAQCGACAEQQEMVEEGL